MRNFLFGVLVFFSGFTALAAEVCTIELEHKLPKEVRKVKYVAKIKKTATGLEQFQVTELKPIARDFPVTASIDNETFSFDVDIEPISKKKLLLDAKAVVTPLLRKRVAEEKDMNVTWRIMEGASCNKTLASLIYFFVYEWFYFA